MLSFTAAYILVVGPRVASRHPRFFFGFSVLFEVTGPVSTYSKWMAPGQKPLKKKRFLYHEIAQSLTPS